MGWSKAVTSLIILLALAFLLHPKIVLSSETFNDLSWPNCDKLTAVSPKTFGIVGALGGKSFTKNPCLTQEAAKFKHTDIYINTGYPGAEKAARFSQYPKDCVKADETCLAYNYGFNASDFAIKYILESGVMPGNFWLDVETENSWSADPTINRQALLGMEARLRMLGKVGYYSYPGQWRLITGNWKNGRDAWVATGSNSIIDAFTACRQSSFTGGVVIYSQYTLTFDNNLFCI